MGRAQSFTAAINEQATQEFPAPPDSKALIAFLEEVDLSLQELHLILDGITKVKIRLIQVGIELIHKWINIKVSSPAYKEQIRRLLARQSFAFLIYDGMTQIFEARVKELEGS